MCFNSRSERERNTLETDNRGCSTVLSCATHVSFSSSQCCNWFYNLQVYPQLLLWPPFQLTRKLLQDWQDTVPLMVTGWTENWSHLMLPQKVSMSATLSLPSLPLLPSPPSLFPLSSLFLLFYVQPHTFELSSYQRMR